MNKNSIKIVFILVVVALPFTACNKKHLDINPFSVTEADYFRTEAEFNKGVLGVYAKLTDLYWYNGSFPLSAPMEIQYLPGDDVTTLMERALEHFGQLTSSLPTTGVVPLFYTKTYAMIGRANILLEKIEAENGVYKTPGLKNTHRGEALFLRGLGYYWLWNFFGRSPLLLKRLTSTTEFTQGPSEENQLLDQAIKDFAEAATLLPASWDAANRGRTTNNAAYAFQGKCLVFRGNVKNAVADYQAAITAFNQISGVVLIPNWPDNFAYDQENNAESLFEFQASRPNGNDNVYLYNDFNDAVGPLSTYWGYFIPGITVGQNGLNFGTTDKLFNAFTPGDRRRDSTIDMPSTASPKPIHKYTRRNLHTPNNNIGSYNNPRILRYADVLLLKAEAILQSGGSTSEAIDLVNQIRTRIRTWDAGLGGSGTIPANYSNAETNKTTIMSWIMNERLIELAGEGQRWFDIRRWHIAGFITLTNDFFNSASADRMAFEAPKHLLMPIPSSEMNNNPNMIQNPGY